jgi:hypothetical protein
VRPESELPSDVREMIDAYAPGLPRLGPVGVDLKRLAGEKEFVSKEEERWLRRGTRSYTR